MSKLNIDQRNIKGLFQDKKADFLIPDYQRPYAWGEDECKTLWEDIFVFAFPDNDCNKFDEDEEYFLGPIVTFKNENGKKEIIDGQQRLTTLMLLLRAFYAKLGKMQDKNSISMRNNIEQCIWKTNEFGENDKEALKIDSEVATDNDKEEFLFILKNGTIPDKTKSTSNRISQYAKNYIYFQNQIDLFLNEFPSYFAYLPARILNNCVLLPIEAESQDTALRIFSTLNDRGKPLSDADIFKAQFYKYFSNINLKDTFIKQWKELEELCSQIFHPISGTPMDDLFTRYMYYERALQGNKSSTTEALRKFYEKDSYKLLHNKETFNNLIILANFWRDIARQDTDRFSNKVLTKLFILNYAPNGMWSYLLSVYFMKNRDNNNKLDDDKLTKFLDTITAFIWTYAITNPGVNALRTPVYAEMINIVNGQDVTFIDYKFDSEKINALLDNYEFTNIRPLTKSMLAWWTYSINDSQPVLEIDTRFDIEHIFAKSRKSELANSDSIEKLGNKSLLESRINIRASDYRFEDKIKYYNGYTNNRGDIKEATNIQELKDIAHQQDFNENDIEDRDKNIKGKFISFLNDCNLLNQ